MKPLNISYIMMDGIIFCDQRNSIMNQYPIGKFSLYSSEMHTLEERLGDYYTQ